MHCRIVSRYHTVYDGPADMVLIPSITGQLGVMRNHIRLYTKLANGIITVKLDQENLEFTSTGGIVEVKPDEVRILVDSSENVDEIDLDRAILARQRADEIIHSTASHSSPEFMRALMLMKKSNLRISAGRNRNLSQGIRKKRPTR